MKLSLVARSSNRAVRVIVLCMLIVLIGASSAHVGGNETPVITYSTDTPEEVLPPLAAYGWKGSANDPKKIVIPAITVDALLQNVGVDQNQQIAVPNNIHIAGWFVDSVRPGEKGLSIIDGHVNGRATDAGVFKDLPNLKIGDELTIVYGDDSKQSFKVYSFQSYKTDDAASVLFSQIPSIERQLNLITCTGNYDREARSYSERQIVVLQAI